MTVPYFIITAVIIVTFIITEIVIGFFLKWKVWVLEMIHDLESQSKWMADANIFNVLNTNAVLS